MLHFMVLKTALIFLCVLFLWGICLGITTSVSIQCKSVNLGCTLITLTVNMTIQDRPWNGHCHCFPDIQVQLCRNLFQRILVMSELFKNGCMVSQNYADTQFLLIHSIITKSCAWPIRWLTNVSLTNQITYKGVSAQLDHTCGPPYMIAPMRTWPMWVRYFFSGSTFWRVCQVCSFQRIPGIHCWCESWCTDMLLKKYAQSNS